MDEEVSGTNETSDFRRMAREFPVRTGLFTFGLPGLALLQVINGVLNGESILAVGAFGAFALLLVGYSAMLTRYHLATYRRERLTSRWTGHGEE